MGHFKVGDRVKLREPYSDGAAILRGKVVSVGVLNSFTQKPCVVVHWNDFIGRLTYEEHTLIIISNEKTGFGRWMTKTSI